MQIHVTQQNMLEVIIYKTLRKSIQIRQTNEDKKKTEISLHTINSEIICIKNEIQSMKSSINELSDMIKAIYEFEI